MRIENYGSEDSKPTIGVTLSPLLLTGIAVVFIFPKMFDVFLTHRRTSKPKKEKAIA